MDNTVLNIGVGGDTIATDDIGGVKHELVKVEFGVDGVATQVSAGNPLPVTDAVADAALASIAAEDFATQTTLAAFLSANHIDLAAILTKLSSDPATQTTLAAILAKIIAAPSTEAKQDTIITALNNIDAGTAAALGQTTMANSMPVTIATDQTPIPVIGTFGGTDNTQLYSNTLAVTGAISGLNTTNYQSVVAQISGTWSGNLIFEGSNDNSTWNILFVLNVSEFTMQDVVYGNGSFVIKTTNKWIRLNLVQLQAGTVTALILGRTVTGVSGADLLAFAMDRSNNLPLFVEETANKKDSSKALIPSDAPAPIYGNAVGTNSHCGIIDTTGYQSICVQFFGTWNAQVSLQSSNDGVNWLQTAAYYVPGTSIVLTNNITSNVIMMVPVSGRYFRALLPAYTSGTVQMIAYLRQQPQAAGIQTNNIAWINGTTPVNAGLAGALGVGGLAANGVAPGGTQPVAIAGIDNTSTGGLTRRILTDTSGRLITSVTDSTGTARALSGLPPASNPYNIASLAVQDVATYEGQTLTELLGQILLELKINNQYMAELPIVLQGQGGFTDEPDVFRNDPKMFVN